MSLNPTTPQVVPAQFNDVLADQLLLQPDAEFIFAKWAYSAALEAQMANVPGFDLARLQMMEGRLVSGAGSPSNMAEAMSSGLGGPLLLSMGMVFPGLVKMVKEAKQPGEVIKINRPKFTDGATTEANRKLGSGSRVFGTDSQPIGFEQVSVEIVEYGGPGDSSGNVVPIEIPRFTQHRAQNDLLVNIGAQLRRDRYKFVDDILMDRLIDAANAGGYVSRPDGISASTDYTGAGNEPMSYDVLVRAVEQKYGRKIPGVGGSGKYIYVADLHQIADLKLDPQFQRLSVFEPQWNPLFPGYMATVENVLVCMSNRMPRLTDLGAGANLTGYQGLLLAPGALGWACAEDARVITSKDDDGGRTAHFAWSAYEGWATLDKRFVQLIVTD